MISYNEHDLYYKSIDVEISPEDEVLFNFELDNIPDVVHICYCDLTDIIDFFNSYEGGFILQKAMSNEIALKIFPTDSVCITKKEKEYLIGHEVLFRKPNIKLYQTWYDSDLKFEQYLGCTIHHALKYFIDDFKNVTFDYKIKNKHFLTLNNLHTPDRESLLGIYKNLSDEDKQKFLCSFRFDDIQIDENLPEIFNTYDVIFGERGSIHYNNTLIEIVSESSESAITEKTYKPLLVGIPFIHWVDNSPNTLHNQIEYFKDLGIDTNYFGIDYTDIKNVEDKIRELLSLSVDEIREKYKEDFIKANENKVKIYSWIENIEQDLIR
jgi:hypothetical protein